MLYLNIFNINGYPNFCIIQCQQEIKRERSEHLISPDMVTKESLSAKRGRRVAAGFLSVFLYNNALEVTRGNEDSMGNKYLDGTALTIAIIGAINWGLIGLFRFDLVAFIFGDMSWLSRIVYVIVGICGIYLLTFFMKLGDNGHS